MASHTVHFPLSFAVVVAVVVVVVGREGRKRTHMRAKGVLRIRVGSCTH